MIRLTRPCTGMRSNGVFPACAAIFPESTIQGASGSMKIRSAALPGAKPPASTPNILAGLALSRVISRLSVTCPSRSDEHTSELQSLLRILYAVFCLTKKKHNDYLHNSRTHAKLQKRNSCPNVRLPSLLNNTTVHRTLYH